MIGVHELETGSLTVDFCGEIHEVDAGSAFTFGRSADLSIDENPYMHRVMARFDARHGRWWVANVGSTIALEVFDRDTRSKAVLMPGSDQALPGANVVVRFAAGPTVYEVDVRCPPFPRRHTALLDVSGGETIQVADLPMTDSQLELILALAEQKLREPQAPLDIPQTKDAARRLGWTTTKFNRKLDNVCDKLTKAGVSGLKARDGALAVDRRRRLVEHCIAVGIVDGSMLDRLGPR